MGEEEGEVARRPPSISNPTLLSDHPRDADQIEEGGDSDLVSLIGAQHITENALDHTLHGDPLRDDSNSYRHLRFFSRDEKDSILANNFYITIPWSPQVYFTVRGAENFHIYLWIAKDLCWTQSWYYPAYLFGSAALAWCLILLYHAISARCLTEVYMLIPMIMWLIANFIWMSGEVFHGDDDSVVPVAAHIMEAAIGWILLYHLVLRPCKIIPSDDLMNKKYEDVDLYPRFSYFQNWRQYEHAHTLCWLGKDLSWNQGNFYTWALCLVPTVFIAVDFIVITYNTKIMTIDVAHYVSLFVWVLANACWACGVFVFAEYVPGYEDDWTTYSIMKPSYNAVRQARWWSSWMLILAFVPILCLYLVWLPLTCAGKITAADIPENRNLKRASFSSFSVMKRRADKKKKKWYHIRPKVAT